MAEKKRVKQKTGKTSQSVVPGLLVRILVIMAVLCLPLLLLAGGMLGVRHLFFAGNPHFTLLHIKPEIMKGNVEWESVRPLLPIKVKKDNLYALNLHQLRTELLKDPLIQEAELRRVLPSTLRVTLYGRTPVARLVGKERRLIDSEGYVLPPGKKRSYRSLPVITGIPDADKFITGKKITDPMILHALDFLALQEGQKDRLPLDINFIIVDHEYRQLRVILRGNPNLFIRDGCCLTIPVTRMKKALSQAAEIIRLRAKNHQPTGAIDPSYRRIQVQP